MKCTCQGAPNPECNYDHASENERIEALRRELASMPKFVAEAIQCIDADELAAQYLYWSAVGPNSAFEFGRLAMMMLGNAIREYTNHCVSNFAETRLCDTGDEAAILRTLIARYR